MQPFVFGWWKSVKVNPDYHLEVERHYYSVPYWFVSRQVQVKVSEQLIEVFQEHQRIACHERSRIPEGHTTVPEHMPPEHWAYKQQSKTSFVAWAEQVGEQTSAQVQAIFESKSHPEQAFRSIRGIQHLAQHYGASRLETACQRANVFGMVGLRRIRSILETQLDKDPLPDPYPLLSIAEHCNLRGSEYYH